MRVMRALVAFDQKKNLNAGDSKLLWNPAKLELTIFADRLAYGLSFV